MTCILLVLALASGTGAATQTPVPCPAALDTLLPRASPAVPDTVPRPLVVEYSEGYGRRLAIHRAASYTMLPLFAAQYAAGHRLYANPGLDGDDWARRAHRPLAYGVAGLFTVNTVTGVWNLWEGRREREGRTRRTAHVLLMLAADAGFAATGVLGSRAANEGGSRTVHRNVAVGSMVVALAGYVVMLPQLRGE